MPFVTRKTALAGAITVAVAIAAVGGFIWSGTYDVGADTPHTRPVHSTLELLRERSIETRAGELQVPADLGNQARIRQGAGNYDAMCTGCHLAPGMAETELSKGLYPPPPNLTKAKIDPAKAFWMIKHGIKASGMPAWGKSMDDEYIWNMAAFLQELPSLDQAKYQALVASSGGHSHGGGETMPHENGGHHDDAGGADHHAPKDQPATTDKAPVGHHGAQQPVPPTEGEVHRHADGKEHVHQAPAKAAPTPAAQKPSVSTDSTPPAPDPKPADEHESHEHHH